MGWMANLKDLFKVNTQTPVALPAETGGKKENIKSDVTRQSGSILPILNYIKEFVSQTETYPWDRIPLWKLKIMWREESCRNACDFLTYLVMKRLGLDNYKHENSKIEQLVKDAVENMDGSFYSHLRDLLGKGLFFGFSALQLVFDVVDSKYLFGWMVNYNSDELEFKVAKNERNKEFISGIKINNTAGQEFSSKNFIIYQYGDLSSPYGYGRGNYLEIYYELKLLCLKMWAIFVQKFTIPTILCQSVNDVGTLVAQCANWLYNNVLGIDMNSDKVELIERKAGLDSSQLYQNCIEFCDKIIYRVFFMLSLISGGEKGGSYALGDKHFDMLVEAAEEIAQDFRDNVIISQILVKLIEYNYGPQKSYGSFENIQPLSIDEKVKIAGMFFQMVNGGVFDPVGDGDYMRAELGAPERTGILLPALIPPETPQKPQQGVDENAVTGK